MSGGPSPDGRVRAEIDASAFLRHSDPTLDLAAMPLGPALNQLVKAGRAAFFRSISPDLVPNVSVTSQLAALEDIVFIGYPSGLRDEKSGLPLIRKGITATPVWNDFRGQPSFLVDAGVFPGSSGSPVFILNQGTYFTPEGVTVGSRLLFLGVLTETMVRSEQTGAAYLGLGRVVRSDAVQAFLNKIATSALARSGLTSR